MRNTRLPTLDFDLGPEIDMLRTTVRGFAEDRVAPLAAEIDAPALGGRENGAVERLEAHGAQRAAIPATVAGSPSHDPSGDNAAPSPTAQP